LLKRSFHFASTSLAAAVLAGALALTSLAVADDDDDDHIENFEVDELGPRTYRARGSFVIAASTQSAWEAITDYEGIPRLAPAAKVSRVVSRDGDNVLVEQEVVASWLFFKKRVHLLLEIVESPLREVAFRDIAEDDFKSYVGFWKLEETSDSLRVSYGLDLERAFSAPDFVAKPLFRSQAKSVMQAMREDILRRTASALPPPAAPTPPAP
jgi:ribosome-associated toxin RatA of RatAB toxin-antitoxin module